MAGLFALSVDPEHAAYAALLPAVAAIGIGLLSNA